MMTPDFKIGNVRRRSLDEGDVRTTKHHTWVAVAVGGSAVLGAGVSMYGANKQSQAARDAAKENKESQAAQIAAAWSNYLMTRGIKPSGASTGQIPQNAQAINARLPLWATANFAKPGAVKTWRRKGTFTQPNTLTRGAVQAAPVSTAPSYDPLYAQGGSQPTMLQ